MKNIRLTEQEIGVVLWAIQKATITEAKRILNNGEKPSENKRVQELNELSKKIYVASL